jgi:hypothetical protein
MREERGEAGHREGQEKGHRRYMRQLSVLPKRRKSTRVRASGVKKPFSLESLHRDTTICVCVSAVCRIPYTCVWVCGCVGVWVSLSQTERWSEGGRVGGREGGRVSGREGVWVG